MYRMIRIMTLVACAACALAQTLVFEGKRGPGKGKHIVLVSGDEEYRSEEALPQLARILAERHGFRCTVLFAIDPADGTINPDKRDNIPGLEALDRADLAVMLIRFRDLPDEQMKHFVDYFEAGRPIVALRTSTHAFDLKAHETYRRYTWDSKDPEGGFGRLVLGETWIAHHGEHKKQSTRGVLVKEHAGHPVLRGIGDGEIWVPTDVYRVRLPLAGDSQSLILGQVLAGMQPTDGPAQTPQNNPMLPVAWVKTYKGGRIFTTTMGSSQDLLNEGLRRLIVNACYWAAGLEKRIPARADVALVGRYQPTPFGFGGARKGVRVEDLR